MAQRQRRFWADEEKRRIVAQARVPGVSVSQVARRYDVNANLVFKWLRDPRLRSDADDGCRFLPVEVVASTEPAGADRRSSESRIEITLASGHRLSISGAFDPDAVSRLLRGLGA